MKYLKYFKELLQYEKYIDSEFLTPNVSHVADENVVFYNPIKSIIYATYLATDENNLAIANTSNVKSLKVNGNNVSFDNKYYFENNGEYEVEIELIDNSVINGAIYDEDLNLLSSAMFSDSENYIGSCLTSITIPDSVTYIGEGAFDTCYSLTNIIIPDSVTSIGSWAFYGCISLPVENDLRYADTYLVGAVERSLSTYTIKEGTKWIGDEAFGGHEGLTSITIPDSVASIGQNAFDSCYSLNGITCLATTPPNINSSTFYNVKQNGILKVPAGSDYSSWMSTDERYLGYYNWTLDEIPQLPSDFVDFVIMTSESNPQVMATCYAQGWAASPNQMLASEAAMVTDIGTAFAAGVSDGYNFTYINQNNRSIKSLDELQHFINLKEIPNNAFIGCEMKSIKLPKVERIMSDAFWGCWLESIELPESVKYIGERVFRDNYQLQTIKCLATVAPEIGWIASPNNLTIYYPAGSDYSSWMRSYPNYTFLEFDNE